MTEKVKTREENQDSKIKNGIKFCFLKPCHSAGTMQRAGEEKLQKIFTFHVSASDFLKRSLLLKIITGRWEGGS